MEDMVSMSDGEPPQCESSEEEPPDSGDIEPPDFARIKSTEKSVFYSKFSHKIIYELTYLYWNVFGSIKCFPSKYFRSQNVNICSLLFKKARLVSRVLLHGAIFMFLLTIKHIA
ncbi:MAG: hypothetical protein AB7U85_05955 [Alphaproteobacteria bacterium]